MNLIKLNIRGISYSQTQTGAYALLLEEEVSQLKLPIIIGAYEAQAIAISLESDIVPSRPLTHDLFNQFAHEFDILITQVIIYQLIDGVFFSYLVCQQGDQTRNIDARTSDAVALAIRAKAPIYTLPEIIDKAGIYLNIADTPQRDAEEENPLSNATDAELETQILQVLEEETHLADLSNEELEAMLKDAVEKENYELAARLRDELDHRV